jgi:hypothetical protein
MGKCKKVHCTRLGRGSGRRKGIYMGKELEDLEWENKGGYNGEANCLFSLTPANHGGK